MVRGCSLHRHEDEVFGYARPSSLNQVAVAQPVHGLRAAGVGPGKPLNRRDNGARSSRRPFDRLRVPHITRHDLDEVAL